MTSELYICIDCEMSNSITEPTPLNDHGLCVRCGSSSVIACSTLRDLADKQRTKVRETPPDVTNARWQAIKDQRKRDALPLITYLRSIMYASPSETQAKLNDELEQALSNWDGWYYHVHYPWEVDTNPFPDWFVVELCPGTKSGTVYHILLDEFVNEVRSFQKGTN